MNQSQDKLFDQSMTIKQTTDYLLNQLEIIHDTDLDNATWQTVAKFAKLTDFCNQFLIDVNEDN